MTAPVAKELLTVAPVSFHRARASDPNSSRSFDGRGQVLRAAAVEERQARDTEHPQGGVVQAGDRQNRMSLDELPHDGTDSVEAGHAASVFGRTTLTTPLSATTWATNERYGCLVMNEPRASP